MTTSNYAVIKSNCYADTKTVLSLYIRSWGFMGSSDRGFRLYVRKKYTH